MDTMLMLSPMLDHKRKDETKKQNIDQRYLGRVDTRLMLNPMLDLVLDPKRKVKTQNLDQGSFRHV